MIVEWSLLRIGNGIAVAVADDEDPVGTRCGSFNCSCCSFLDAAAQTRTIDGLLFTRRTRGFGISPPVLVVVVVAAVTFEGEADDDDDDDAECCGRLLRGRCCLRLRPLLPPRNELPLLLSSPLSSFVPAAVVKFNKSSEAE